MLSLFVLQFVVGLHKFTIRCKVTLLIKTVCLGIRDIVVICFMLDCLCFLLHRWNEKKYVFNNIISCSSGRREHIHSLSDFKCIFINAIFLFKYSIKRYIDTLNLYRVFFYDRMDLSTSNHIHRWNITTPFEALSSTAYETSTGYYKKYTIFYSFEFLSLTHTSHECHQLDS
jgi:hypothetical protein